MKCYVFSIGERTTHLCCDLMRKYGFDVELLYNDQTSLYDKLHTFYQQAYDSGDEFVARIDADIIPNRNVIKLAEEAKGWTCAVGYDWYKQDRGAISIHIMERKIIKKCLDHVMEAKNEIRPETYLWRLKGINRHTRILNRYSCGIHGYGQKDHRTRIMELKYNRGQNYEWDLIERIERI